MSRSDAVEALPWARRPLGERLLLSAMRLIGPLL